MLSFLAFAPTFDGARSAASAHRHAWERALRACPTVAPADPLSSPCKIHDIILTMSSNVCIFVTPLPPGVVTPIHAKFKNVFQSVSRGRYTLTSYGEELIKQYSQEQEGREPLGQ